MTSSPSNSAVGRWPSSVALGTTGLNPRWFGYPSLGLYMLAAVLVAGVAAWPPPAPLAQFRQAGVTYAVLSSERVRLYSRLAGRAACTGYARPYVSLYDEIRQRGTLKARLKPRAWSVSGPAVEIYRLK